MDGEGRRRLCPHLDRGSRRLGSAPGRAHHQRDRVHRVLRAPRADRRDAARALGRPEDAARYDRLFASIRTDFNARFLSPDGIYREKDSDPFVQTAQILPLAFGLVPDDRRAALATGSRTTS